MKTFKLAASALFSLSLMIPALAQAAAETVDTRAILYAGESASGPGFTTIAVLVQGDKVELVGCSVLESEIKADNLAKILTEDCDHRYPNAQVTHYVESGAVVMSMGIAHDYEPMFPMVGAHALGIQANIKSDDALKFTAVTLMVPAAGNIENEVTRITARKIGEARIQAAKINGSNVQ